MRTRLAAGVAVGMLALVLVAATPGAAETTATDITSAPGFDSLVAGLVQLLEGLIAGLQSLVGA